MIEAYDTVTGTILVFLVLVLVFGLGGVLGNSLAPSNVKAAITECEKELPRHQTCGYKIVTFVEEGK